MSPYFVATIVVAVIAFLALAMILAVRAEGKRLTNEAPVPPGEGDDVGYVDPWDYQRNLMAVSDQALPGLPTISKGSVLYYALVLEETAETGQALLTALHRTFPAMPNRSANELTIIGKITSVVSRIEESSMLIKGALKQMPDFAYTLSRTEAIAILDGTTDIQVVNSGFALASGLPAQEGYIEVVSSNLSKVDPRTGRIEKSMDGKWLKGSEYVEPNLERILQQHLESRAKAIKADMAREDAAAMVRLAKEANRVAPNHG